MGELLCFEVGGEYIKNKIPLIKIPLTDSYLLINILLHGL